MMQQRKKPAKLTWTLRWRIMHKKGKAEEGVKKRSRRARSSGALRPFVFV